MFSAFRWYRVLAGCLVIHTALLQAETVEVDFSVYEYPPLYHTSTSGRFSGTLGETILKICDKAQLDCRPVLMPIARAYERTISGQSDMTISATHPRFDKCCVASQWNYPWSAGFFSRLPSTKVPESEAQMKGKSMIVVRGWRSHYRFMPNFDQLVESKEITVLYANSNYSAISMLKRGRAELLWGAVDYLWYLDKLNLSDEFSYSERLQIPIVLWVNKQRPQLVETLNDGYEQLKQDGLLDQQNLLRTDILHQYYEDAPLKKGH